MTATIAPEAPMNEIVMNETITESADHGYWAGVGYITHHTYGEQVHRSRSDAQRWNEAQAKIRPAR